MAQEPKSKRNAILVAGGAGYIGSHMVQALLDAGEKAVALDDLSTGHRDLVPEGVVLEVGSLGNRSFLQEVFKKHQISAVMHFAARSLVGESVKDPRSYWRSNVADTVTLLDVMKENGVKEFVFSSTCSVYGEPQTALLSESHPRLPVSPYGKTKRAVEEILEDCAIADGLKFVTLRYFNAAGADPLGRRGEKHSPETHLIPNILQAGLKEGTALTIFGKDYPTSDGTPIRDYIHVLDLAEAHLLALRSLQKGATGQAYNLGTGKGYSVLAVIAAAEKVVGRNIPVKIGPRRPGDPACLVASAEKAKKELGWNPSYDLADILEHSWKWQKTAGNPSRPAAKIL